MELALLAMAAYLCVAIIVIFRILRDKSIDSSTGFVFLAIGASLVWPIVLTLYLFDKN